MNLQLFDKYFARSLFIIASAAVCLAFLEWLAQFLGISLINEMYPPGRILELTAALMVFVIAVLLRQIRDELRGRQGI